MKVVKKMPVKKDLVNASKRIAANVRYANYGGFFVVFVYTNIALYFLFMIKLIFGL